MSEMMIPHSKPTISREDIDAVTRCIDSGMIAMGSETALFADDLRRYLGYESLFLTPSGTSALTIALKALSVGNGDEVILPTYVCHEVADAVRQTGALPVLCDIGEAWCLTPHTVEKVMTRNTRAIIAVNIFGIKCDIAHLKETGLPIIEDSCQSFGKHEKMSDIEVFSFHATKCLTAGEGGCVATTRKDLAEKISEMNRMYDADFRFSALQSALGRSQLRRYDGFISRREAMYAQYMEILHPRITQATGTVEFIVPFRFPIRIEASFENLKNQMSSEGISIRRGVDELLHQRIGGDDATFVTADKMFSTTISLPLYPSLSTAEISFIADRINKIC